jgi:[acyl-carrier-protein] S-malonyltransferase
MSLALLFSGQGLQHAGMLPWIDSEPAAAALLAAMARHLGAGWRQGLADAAWAERNDVAQRLITGTGLAAWQVLKAHGLPEAAVCAGYSVGELAAFSAAGVFDAPTALQLAGVRAEAMDRSAGGRAGGLMAVSGEAAAELSALLGSDVELAIRIAPDRCILGGDRPALRRVGESLAARGAEVSLLRIQVASHTSQMHAAARAFAEHLAGSTAVAPWRPPRCPLIVNLDGAARRDLPTLQRCLSAQLAQTVQWQQCLQTLAERRPSCVLEIGAGTALSRMWLALGPDVPSRSVDEFADPAGVVEWVRQRLRQ